MAELILGPIVDVTVSMAISLASEQINAASEWNEDLRRFSLVLSMIGGMLQHVNEEQINKYSHLKAWFRELRAVADEAHHVLDEIAYENLQRKTDVHQPNWKKVSYFFTPSNPLAFRLRVTNKMKNLSRYLAEISDWATRLGLQYKLADQAHQPRLYQHTPLFLPSPVLGREEDVSKIVSLLIDSSNQQDLDLSAVITIVGMPGLGKTTLAKAVCQTDEIGGYFGKNVMWVSVPKDFDVLKILIEMLESISKRGGGDIGSKDDVLRKIQEELGGKNYLLILDDVWNVERQKLEELRTCLLGISKIQGSRVLVTTRSKRVAWMMGTLPENLHYLEGLANDHCLAVIKQRAFVGPDIPKELNAVATAISGKCKGVPLIASLAGGILYNRRDIDEWVTIKNNDAWTAVDSSSWLSGVMKLSFESFNRLPEPGLKQCFAVCSIFPSNFVIERQMLIQLWMGQGFLQPPDGSSMTMEDIGHKYFNDLLTYSLFQEEERDSLGRVKSCRIHDIIRDLAESIYSETMIVEEGSDSNISHHVRHLNLIYGMPKNLEDVAQKLSTLFMKHGFPHNMHWQNFKRLRVVSFCDAGSEQVPKCIGKSKSLRYLDISGTKIKKLPKFITKMYNLQTFRFMNCRCMKMPSGGIGDLINLRHIYFNDEERMPTNLGRLTNLQTLQFFFVGTTKGRKIEELGGLSGLKGRLEIRKLELVKDKSEAAEAKLHEKAIEELELSWGAESNHDKDGVLEGLQPHSNLQRLLLNGYGGENLPSWMLEMNDELFLLSNLVELSIRWCQKLKCIPSSKGVFSSLQRLLIEGCSELTSIDDCAFASTILEELYIWNCPKLERVVVSKLASLQTLNISYCEVFSSIGDGSSHRIEHFMCLRDLSLSDCPNVRLVPSLYESSPRMKLRIVSCDRLEHLPSWLLSCRYIQKLEIQNCSNLVSILEESSSIEDSLSPVIHLKELSLFDCPNLRFLPSPYIFASLEKLRIVSCDTLEYLPSELFFSASFEKLEIQNCPNLVSVPIKSLNLCWIKEIDIVHCMKLRSFPEESLRCHLLKRLSIGPFSQDLEEFPLLSLIQVYHTLKELCLKGWDKLTQLPHQIQYLTTLKKLKICSFNQVEALPHWLGNLSSLQCLEVSNCNNLKYLPSAEAIQRLSNLQTLIIGDCPKLEERCAKEQGPEWSKISHIPKIRVSKV
ncbi:hypothetical protein SLE2022_221900 [Rubroshorea leprosula]